MTKQKALADAGFYANDREATGNEKSHMKDILNYEAMAGKSHNLPNTFFDLFNDNQAELKQK